MKRKRKEKEQKKTEGPNNKSRKTLAKKKCKCLEIFEADIIKHRNERKSKKKWNPLNNKKTSRNQALQQKSHQKDKHLSRPPCKVIWTILKMSKGENHSNGPKDKESWWWCTRTYTQEITLVIYVKKRKRKGTRHHWGLGRCNNSRSRWIEQKKKKNNNKKQN